MSKIVPIRLDFTNVASNANLSLAITSDNVSWSIGSNQLESSGLQLLIDPAMRHTISKIGTSRSLLSISTYNDSTANILTSFSLTLFLSYTGEKLLKGMATLNSECEVVYHINHELSGGWKNGFISATW